MNTYDHLFKRCGDFVEYYREDLTEHDRDWIDACPGVPFLHFTHFTGTDLIGLYPADHSFWPARGTAAPYLFGMCTREHILDQIEKVTAYCADEKLHDLALYFDGKEFHEITDATAKLIAREYVQRVANAWDQAAAVA